MGQELNGSLGSWVTLSDPFPALIGTADDFAGGVDDLADSTGAADDMTGGAGNLAGAGDSTGAAADTAGGAGNSAGAGDSTGAADDTTCGAGNTITDINRTIYCTGVSSHHKTLSEVEILTIRPMNRSMNPRTTTHQQVTWLVLAT